MKDSTRFYPRLEVDTTTNAAVAQAGGVMLTDTIAATGLAEHLRAGLTPWRKDQAVHDPSKVLLDLALTAASGGARLSDIAVLRAEPGVYGLVASDPTVSRTIDTLAGDVGKVLAAIDRARATARAVAWGLAGPDAPDHDASAQRPVVVDLDATLVTAHSDKESAARTWKKGYGFHPLCAFVDHGTHGTGEPLAIRLRAGNAGSDTATDHITVTRQALARLPGHTPGSRPGRRVLVRTDGAGATHGFMNYLAARRVSYSVGYTLPTDTADLLKQIPEQVWTPACNAEGEVREGAWVAEPTGLLDLTGRPRGMRVIARKERPRPGAQLRITDIDGHRITAFATNTSRGQLADLELRHRRRARCEDRIRNAKDTGLRALPLHDFAQNQIWCAILAPAGDLVAWMQMLGLAGTTARKREPKRAPDAALHRARHAADGPPDSTSPRKPPGPTSSRTPSPDYATSPGTGAPRKPYRADPATHTHTRTTPGLRTRPEPGGVTRKCQSRRASRLCCCCSQWRPRGSRSGSSPGARMFPGSSGCSSSRDLAHFGWAIPSSATFAWRSWHSSPLSRSWTRLADADERSEGAPRGMRMAGRQPPAPEHPVLPR